MTTEELHNIFETEAVKGPPYFNLGKNESGEYFGTAAKWGWRIVQEICKERQCEWTLSQHSDLCLTNCGRGFDFGWEKFFKYCPYCGGKVVVK